MSSIQGEEPTTRKGKIVGGIVAGIISAALVAAVTMFVVQVRAGQEQHQQLLEAVKTNSITRSAAASEDAAMVATAARATEVGRLQRIADETAARLAAEAIAKAQSAQAEAHAAAQEAAQRTDTRSGDPTPGGNSTGPVKCPAGSQANSGDGENDTSCFPEICFHVVLPDPAYPQCEVAFKP